jgi:hypothetical protein
MAAAGISAGLCARRLADRVPWNGVKLPPREETEMKKREGSKKLGLHRETLRSMDRTALKGLAGATGSPCSDTCDDTYASCGSYCSCNVGC